MFATKGNSAYWPATVLVKVTPSVHGTFMLGCPNEGTMDN